MFDDIWAKAGKVRSDYVEFSKCDPFYRIFDHEHVPFDYNDDEMFILREIDKRNPADKRGYLNFVHMAKRIFDKGFVELADKPFHSVADMLRVAPDLIRLQSYKSVYQFVSGYVQDPFLRQVFSFHPLLVGGNPFDTTSIYAMIHYLEREWGVWYALGGTGKLVEAFGRLIEDDPSIAPEGHEAFYVLSPVPHLGADIDWAQAARPYRDAIMQFLEDNYLPDLQANLVTEHMVDPRYFATALNSFRGSAFSVEPILTQSAWFRPHNRSEDFGNLYFVGAGTHPGAGLPGVLSSSKIAEDLITSGAITSR
jgi:phytoene dehydrogenase-like protein